MTELTKEELQAQLEAMKVKATTLGITYSPNIGFAALRDKVNAAMNGEPLKEIVADENYAEETLHQKRGRIRKECQRLVRVNVQCKNPMKKDWRGEIITASNDLVSEKKFVLFDSQDGYHLPQIILNVLKEREYPHYYTTQLENGMKTRKSRMVPEFAIEILAPLTEAELATLARRQAMQSASEIEV